MKYVFKLCIKVSIVVSVLVYGVSYVEASTLVPNTPIVSHVEWTASSSPYIIQESVYVDRRGSLTIGPGVEVMLASTSLSGSVYDRPNIYVNGSLLLNGTAQAPVSIHGISGINIDFGSLDARHSIIDVPLGINVVSSQVYIASSTIKNAEWGIHDIASSVYIVNSHIDHNGTGLYVAPIGGVPMARDARDARVSAEVGGVGNAFEDSPILVAMNTSSNSALTGVFVSSSTLVGNTEYAIKNDGKDTVHATNNWWGSSDGPVTATSSSISGLVEYDPWIKHEKPCCSSVLFIPGIEGSRLYSVTSARGVTATSTRRVWEPHSNTDIAKLYLNSMGSSTDTSIYADGPVDVAYGISSVYGSFMKFLNTLSSRNIITEWKSFGYDWRKSIQDIVAGNEKRATTTESLVGLIQAMASSSKTGKVTVVAHSNGGLVAKYLVKKLTDMGKSNLVDAVIGVAVPYVGTPEAIPDLLHGYNQSILNGLILKDSTARSLAVNMPSIYSLLPSAAYFTKVLSPSIAFASTTTAGINNGVYPRELNTISGQNAFIADTNNVRKNPIASDTSTPIKGNQLLLGTAGLFHGILDSFTWPESIAHWSILGWNIPTIKTLFYQSTDRCVLALKNRTCPPRLLYGASTTAMGDGTVVAPSAAYDTNSVVSIDLKHVSKLENMNISHANILESSTTQKQIEDIITHAQSGSSTSQPFIPGISYGEPDYTKEPAFIVVHSQGLVGLNVYDSAGHHTGGIPVPTGVTDDVMTAYEETIPGSRYQQLNDKNKSIYIPDMSGRYSIVVQGSGVGTFDLSIDRVRGGTILDTTHFDTIPVTPTTVASTTVSTGDGGVIATPSLASSTTVLTVDASGGGSSTLVIPPNVQPDTIKYLDIFKKFIDRIDGSRKHSKDIYRRIERLQELWKKSGRMDIHKGKEYVGNWIHHIRSDRGLLDEKDRVIDDIDRFISQFE